MLDLQEINMEIARLEYKESSYSNYAKLAVLYAIRDKMQRGDYDAGMSMAAAPAVTADVEGDSDFLRAVRGKDSARAWAVMDELMDTLRVVNGKVYNRIMEKIMDL